MSIPQVSFPTDFDHLLNKKYDRTFPSWPNTVEIRFYKAVVVVLGFDPTNEGLQRLTSGGVHEVRAKANELKESSGMTQAKKDDIDLVYDTIDGWWKMKQGIDTYFTSLKTQLNAIGTQLMGRINIMDAYVSLDTDPTKVESDIMFDLIKFGVGLSSNLPVPGIGIFTDFLMFGLAQGKNIADQQNNKKTYVPNRNAGLITIAALIEELIVGLKEAGDWLDEIKESTYSNYEKLVTFSKLSAPTTKAFTKRRDEIIDNFSQGLWTRILLSACVLATGEIYSENMAAGGTAVLPQSKEALEGLIKEWLEEAKNLKAIAYQTLLITDKYSNQIGGALGTNGKDILITPIMLRLRNGADLPPEAMKDLFRLNFTRGGLMVMDITRDTLGVLINAYNNQFGINFGPTIPLFIEEKAVSDHRTIEITEGYNEPAMVDTGLTIEKGMQVHITATGNIWSGLGAQGCNGPNGWVQWLKKNYSDFPAPGERIYSLLGHKRRRNKSGGYSYETFFVGQEGYIDNREGEPFRLFLAINDNNVQNGDQCKSVVLGDQKFHVTIDIIGG